MDVHAQHTCGGHKAAFKSLLFPPTLGPKPKVLLHNKPPTSPGMEILIWSACVDLNPSSLIP